MFMFQSTPLVGCDRFNFIKEVPKGKDIHTSYAAGEAKEEVATAVEDNLIHELADYGLINIIGGNAIQNPGVRKDGGRVARQAGRLPEEVCGGVKRSGGRFQPPLIKTRNKLIAWC